MKKLYSAPTIQSTDIEMQGIIAQSGVKSNNGLGYGGVDREGTKDPGVKKKNSLWDEEW